MDPFAINSAVLSRQFRPLPKSRIDGLLTSFPKLIPVGSQHTTVETAEVRFVYQPFDELYVMLITNKGSNILQVCIAGVCADMISLDTAYPQSSPLSCRIYRLCRSSCG